MSKITIKNFLSFEKAEIDFNAYGNDVVLVLGRNEDSDYSTSNGSGKCLPLDAPILMADGSKRKLGDVRSGDWVMCADLTSKVCVPSPVVATTLSGIKQVYKIEFSDGGSVIASEEHEFPMYLYARDKNKSIGQTAKLRKVKVKELLNKYNGRDLNSASRARMLTYPVYFNEQDLPLDPYFVGLLIGDGMLCNSSGSPGVWITNKDEEILVWCADITNRLGGHWRRGAKGEITHHIAGKKDLGIIGPLNSLGLLGTRSDTKFIPQIYLRSSTKQRLELLAGLIDTDGYVEPRGSLIEYGTKSTRLKDDIIELFYSLGGRASCSRRKDGNWRIFGHLPKNTVLPLRVPYKLKNWTNVSKKSLDYSFRVVRKITPVGEMECGDIQVQHRDHCFVSYDNVVTGNSAIFESLVWCLYAKTLRGAATNAIIREGQNECEVTLYWKDSIFTRKKVRNKGDVLSHQMPGTPTVFGSVVEEFIEQTFGTFDVFTSTHFLSDQAVDFMSLTDSNKKTLLESFISVGEFDKAKEYLKEKLEEVEGEIKNWERKVMHTEGAITILKRQAEGFDPEALDTEETVAKKELAGSTKALQEAEKALRDLPRAKESTDKQKLLDANQTCLNEHLAEVGKLEAKKEALEKKRDKLSKGICPTCGQQVPAQEVSRITSELGQLLVTLGGVQSKVEGEKTFRDQLNKQIGEITSAAYARLKEVGRLNGIITSSKASMRMAEQTLRGVESRRIKQAGLKDEIGQNMKILNEANEKLDEAKALVTAYEFWSKAFGSKGLKTFAIKSVVDLLNTHIQNVTQAVYGNEVRIALKINEEKMTVNIPVETAWGVSAYENLSAGEKRRVKVIILTAFQLLVYNLGMGKELPVVYDEVFDGLDERGIESVVGLIQAKKMGPTFVISHDDSTKSLFTTEITVVKDQNGVSSL